MAAPALEVAILDAPDADFAVEIEVVPSPASGPALEPESGRSTWTATVRVTYAGSAPADAAVRISTRIPADDPWFLIPGAFYGENRPADNDRIFPRFQPGASSAADHAAMVSDEWHFRADRAATPIVFCWAASGQEGVALGGSEIGELGEQSIGFAAGDGFATLSLTAPAREHPVSYYGDGVPRPAESELHRFVPGETITLVLSLHGIAADRHDYDRVLRELHRGPGAAHPAAGVAPVAPVPSAPLVSIDDAAAIAAEGLTRWHFDPDPGVLLETVGFDREVTGGDGRPVDRQAMHIGWVSGIPWATALLQHAHRTSDAEAARIARSVLDFCTAELSPSGTFWGVWYRSGGWTQSWTRHPRGLHARTLGEATDFLVRTLTTHDDPQWRAAARSNLDAMVARQRADGNLGAVHDADTGEILSWEGSAGLAWIPALVGAADWDPRYLRAAERAGDYYAAFVLGEYLHGAPEDVDLAPTSEDGYIAVMAYTALYRATRQPRWLDLARRSAEWMLTFRYSYDVLFRPLTPLGAAGFSTRGADQASSSNQHLHAYGLICTADLLDLSAWTGDSWYRDRALETVDCFRQLLPERDGDYNAYRGMITERYYQTECFQPKGMVLTLSHAWSAGVLLLACEQLLARGEAAA
ncbi:hypothetical protein [Naasia lichenicola]|uniref:Uncharacterized protein n=1 Tax=Naasia lichenicola TaxID=2565933 RepID=A0A4S4FGA4_9MICO|nr:hypothetical protein [Naasia lichenicola]THG29269.1 hypothetical protein E6C64_11095 [Naasia lichenicola]